MAAAVAPLSMEQWGASTFARRDPHREAQELLNLMRPLAPPKPSDCNLGTSTPRPSPGAARALSASVAAAASSPASASAHARGGGSTPRGAATGGRRGEASVVLAEEGFDRRISARIRKHGGGAHGAPLSARAWAGLRLLQQHAGEAPEPNFRRRNVLLDEQLQMQGRWPAEARWAGHTPDFIRERHDRLGTLANERGDGRTLPHERPERWWYPG
mmetsp:Transcript_4354/g.10508  ORF Transcript_4354/g.10508 Transcript_4354/m.10508 type:complete len:215 (-) Transcript_4354:19-663(-)